MSLDIWPHGLEPDSIGICVVCCESVVLEDMVVHEDDWHCERCAAKARAEVDAPSDIERAVAQERAA